MKFIAVGLVVFFSIILVYPLAARRGYRSAWLALMLGAGVMLAPLNRVSEIHIPFDFEASPGIYLVAYLITQAAGEEAEKLLIVGMLCIGHRMIVKANPGFITIVVWGIVCGIGYGAAENAREIAYLGLDGLHGLGDRIVCHALYAAIAAHILAFAVRNFRQGWFYLGSALIVATCFHALHNLVPTAQEFSRISGTLVSALLSEFPVAISWLIDLGLTAAGWVILRFGRLEVLEACFVAFGFLAMAKAINAFVIVPPLLNDYANVEIPIAESFLDASMIIGVALGCSIISYLTLRRRFPLLFATDRIEPAVG